MKKNYMGVLMALLLCLGVVTSCTTTAGDDLLSGSQPQVQKQKITVVVESVGESVSNSKGRPQSRKPISSVTPTQTFDKLELVILEELTQRIVYMKKIDNWSATNNQSSVPYVDGNERGRMTTLEIPEYARLEDGKNYMIYAVGYQTGSFGGYVPFKGLKEGDKFTMAEIVRVPEGGVAEEIFAGAELLHVENGKIVTKTNSDAAPTDAVMILRRQVSSMFGYFTHITAKYHIGGKEYKAARLRLVASRANHSLILGGFRSMEDPENFNQENVINGYEPRDDYDAELVLRDRNGREFVEKKAFVKYDIDLSKWFPGSEEGVPFDQNGDGFLDGNDMNWKVDEERYPDNIIKLQRGSVFGDCFMVASAMYEEDVKTNLPTFQFQVLDKDGKILVYRDVYLREESDFQKTRTIVYMSNSGRPEVRVEDNPENEFCYSIVRNHLYSMGEKNYDQSYGEDKPIDLGAADYLVLDVDNEWEAGGSIVFG